METIKVTDKDFYNFNRKLGLKRFIYSIDYIRCFEYPLVLNNLQISKGMSILDVGSGTSIFPLFLAFHGCKVIALDINQKALSQLMYDAKKMSLKKNFRIDISDARNLLYDNNLFDRVCAISSIEHIPEDGDIKAVKEMSRVLKKGGKLVITVPMINSPHKSYFERKYDDDMLIKRIIKPSKLKIEKIEYFGDKKIKFANFWYKIPFPIRIPLMHLQYIPSKLFFGLVTKDKARDVCITLKKVIYEFL